SHSQPSRSCIFPLATRPATTRPYTLSLHDALPICPRSSPRLLGLGIAFGLRRSDFVIPTRIHKLTSKPIQQLRVGRLFAARAEIDRKSTRLNSSHGSISYAVLCLNRKNNRKTEQ